MTPALRLSFSLVLSLLIWLPTVPGALATSEDPARIALRYLIGLIISRVGVGIVFRIINAYTVEETETTPEPETATEPGDLDPYADFGRRREDFGDIGRSAEDLLDEALDDVADQQALAQP